MDRRPPDLPLSPLPNRMDDVFSAIFLGALLRLGPVQEALEHATASLFTLAQATPPGSRDLPLVAAQVAIVAPALRFAARSLA